MFLLKAGPFRLIPSTVARTTVLCVALLTALLVSVTPVHSADADVQPLIDFTDSLTTFSARFEQTVYDSESNPLQQSSGSLKLKRPGQFAWYYEMPSPQDIVSDGVNVWLYDRDLEQVTVSSITDRASGTPLALLTGSASIKEGFSIAALGEQNGISWYELTSRDTNSDFELIFLGLADNVLTVMELRDSFGQATQIKFSDIEDGSDIADSEFTFVPPEGVDVIGQPQ